LIQNQAYLFDLEAEITLVKIRRSYIN